MKLIFSLISLLIIGCATIRDTFTFFPDTKTKIDHNKLPEYFQHKIIKTTDGESLSSFYLKHGDNGSDRLVVYFHGNAGNNYHRLEYINQLFLNGIDVLIVDYRGYGESSGSPTEEGIYLDGFATIDYALDSLGYKESKLNIIGRSLGSAVAVEVSRNRPVESLILITPISSGRDIGEVIAPSISSVAMESYDSKSKVTEVISPTLIISGGKDRLTPITMGWELYNLLKVEDKEFVEIKNGGHGDLQDKDRIKFWSSILKFLKLGA